MSYELTLPKLGFSMVDADIAEWLVEDGAEVTEGQSIYTVEADKATQEVPAPISGKLRILAVKGEKYEVGALLGYID